MYHSRFVGTHYQAGFNYGSRLAKNNKFLKNNFLYELSKERKDFTLQTLTLFEKFYPEILDEIRGIANAQNISFEELATFLLSMYCFDFNNRCSTLAIKNNNQIILAKNSDFLTKLEKLYDSCFYKLDNAYSFIGNTTAFTQIEDGINEHGLAIALTFVCPKTIKPGFNSGMLVRYLLEKSKTVEEVLEKIKVLPIASSQTLTVADSQKNMAIIECNCTKISVISNSNFLVASNYFISPEMEKFNVENIDNWKAEERYNTLYKNLSKVSSENHSIDFIKNLLSGKFGFICQYDRKSGIDTVWSSIYEINNKKIFRAEGNPSRKNFIEDKRLKFSF